MYYATAPLNVRAKPSVTASRVGSLAQGQTCTVDGWDGRWAHVRYRTAWRTVTGWAHGDYLARVSANRVPHVPGVVAIPDDMRSDDLRAQQYVRVDGRRKYNLCGQFCAAALGGLGIDAFLRRLRAAYPALYAASVTQDRPTSIDTVAAMLSAAEVEAGGGVDLTAQALADALDGGSVVVGVHIDRAGRLVSRGGVGHWVVVTAIEPVLATAWVTIYNPYPNAYEYYWLDDLRASAAAFGGAVTLRAAAQIDAPQPPPDCTQARINALRQARACIDKMISEA